MNSVFRIAVMMVSVGTISTLAIGAVSQATAPRIDSSAVDSAAVAQVVNEYHAALESGDSATALRLLTSDARILESGGIETRDEYRSHHLSGDIQFAKAVESKRAPVHVTLAGTTAWTASTSTAQGTFNGRAINSLGAESMVLTKESNGWRIRAIHWSSRTRRD